MISNAKDTLLSANPGSLPNVSGAMFDYFRPLTFTKITKSVVNSNLVETQVQASAMGVRQPLSAQQLSMKPEGQREWKWETIHALPDLVLNPDDVIVFGTTSYRVMQKWNWSEYGFVEYHVVEDYV